MNRKPYPSDLTDDQWAVLEDLIPPAKPGGCPRQHDMREVLTASDLSKDITGDVVSRIKV
jgi:putative transposase